MEITRRSFIKGGIGTVGLYLTLPQLLGTPALAQGGGEGKRKIVIVQLAGGNDGINTAVPYGLGQYYKLRPTLAIKPDAVLAMDSQVGLHPSMTAMHKMYKDGKVAVMLGVGYPNPNRSHFRSIEIWQTANPDKIIDTGWLGRYLDYVSTSESKNNKRLFPAINVDPIMPKTLSAQSVVVPSVYDVNLFKFNTDSHYRQDRQCQVSAFNNIYANFDLDRPSVAMLKEVGLDTMKASDYLAKVVASYKGNVNYPANGFSKGLKFISQMIVAGVDATIFNISLGGFDTHANQSPSQANLLKNLSEGVTAFQNDLEDHGLDKDVILMTFSEFGRRAAENGGRGTDHGTAEPMFIIGSSIKGGIYGDYPSLTDLDQGDLKHKLDFRTVYATVLDRWLGADSKAILGASYDNIAFV